MMPVQPTKEGFTDEKCFNVGNTVEDMLWRFLPQASTQSRILKDLEVSPKDYILLTAHRQENTENITRLHDILSSVFETAAHHNLKKRSSPFILEPEIFVKIKSTHNFEY